MLDAPGGYDTVLVGYDRAPVADSVLIDALDDACRRSQPEVVVTELGRLRVGCAGRVDDVEAWLMVVGDEIEEFPPDVIKAACRAWMRREKWTPSVAELVAECERLVKPRRLMLQAAVE